MDSTVSNERPAVTRAPRSRRARVIGTVIAVLAMLALAALAWHLTHQDAGTGAGPGGGRGGRGGPGGPGGRGGPPTTVGVASAERADIPVVLDALGTVTAAATATVRPQVSGVLQKIDFAEGQMVRPGQVLATIDPRPFQMALLQASGQRQRDEAQLDSARVTLERYRTLLAQDSIARQEVDTQAALVKQLEGTVTTDRGSEGMARLNLGYTQVKAPIGGRVGLRTVDIGNLVGSGDANGIAVITQLSPIDVQFAVPQDQVPELQARIRDKAALPATALDRTRTDTLATGAFSALDNQVDVQTGTVKAKARFANADLKLFPSQFVNLRLQVRTIKDAVVVPVTALRHGADGDFVYVLDAPSRTVSLRTVTRGQATADKVEIRRGLQAGEQVITEGADRLKDGAKVALPGDKPAMGGGRGGAGRGNWGGGAGRRHGGAAGGAPEGAGGVADAASQLAGLGPGDAAPTLSAAARAIGSVLAEAMKAGPPATALVGRAPLVGAPGADPGQLAGALQQAIANSGLFYESHVAEWAAGKRPLAALAAEPQMQMQAGGDGLQAAGHEPQAGAQLANLQLAAHEQGQLAWQGLAWPGQPLQLELQRVPLERDAPQRDDDADPAAASWQSRLRLRFPLLGEVSASVLLSGDQVHLRLEAHDETVGELLRAHAARLAGSLGAAGTELASLAIHAPGAGDA